MIRETLQDLFERDLLRLIKELELYQLENNIWLTSPGIANSAGNLCLHLIGSLNGYIGVALAKTDYKRQRDLEFSSKDISRSNLLKRLKETMAMVRIGLGNVSDESIKESFPINILDKTATTEFALIHLLTHVNYHLGQVNYHRRLLDK